MLISFPFRSIRKRNANEKRKRLRFYNRLRLLSFALCLLIGFDDIIRKTAPEMEFNSCKSPFGAKQVSEFRLADLAKQFNWKYPERRANKIVYTIKPKNWSVMEQQWKTYSARLGSANEITSTYFWHLKFRLPFTRGHRRRPQMLVCVHCHSLTRQARKRWGP